VPLLVCLGDSFTEGLSDEPRADGRHRGWADRVADGLARADSDPGDPVRYANLAVRGNLLDDVVRGQVPVAVDLHPDIVTFHAGPNDVLRPGTDLPALFARYDDAVALLTGSTGRVVLFTSIGRAGGTGRLADRLADRFELFNANVRAVAAGRECLLVDLGRITALMDRRLWDTDRLHLNAAGHARVAAAVLASLGVTDAGILGGPAGWWAEPLPPAPRVSRRAAIAADAHWARVHLAPWVLRRLRGVSSGDGVLPKDPVPRVIGPAA
jgi:lysophospholipase L1-like esterase